MLAAVLPLLGFEFHPDFVCDDGVEDGFEVGEEIDVFGLLGFEVLVREGHLEEVSVEALDEEENGQDGLEDTPDIGDGLEKFIVTAVVDCSFTTYFDFDCSFNESWECGGLLKDKCLSIRACSIWILWAGHHAVIDNECIFVDFTGVDVRRLSFDQKGILTDVVWGGFWAGGFNCGIECVLLDVSAILFVIGGIADHTEFYTFVGVAELVWATDFVGFV